MRNWRSILGPFYRLAVALQFFTRLPLPRDLNPEKDDLGKASAWFPVVGLITGGSLAVVALLLGMTPWPPVLQAAVILVAAILVTGGFHEDGLADSADGLWGGWTREDRLRIMRDSRIGSYGALALLALFMLRGAALLAIDPAWWPTALVLGHVMGRWTSLPLILTLPYARAKETSATKPLIESVTPARVFLGSLIALGIGIACTVWQPLILVWVWIVVIGVMLAGRALSKRYVEGITGDLLGAINVCAEVCTLVVFATFAHAPERLIVCF